LIIAISIGTCLTAIALPNVLMAYDRLRLNSTAMEFSGMIQRTRSTAVSQNAPAALRLTANAGFCPQASTLWIDANSNGTMDSTEFARFCVSPRIAVAVTNLATARAELIRSGPLAEFMLASGAFPALFAARPIGDGLYWDGGLANAIPLDAWLEDPAIHTIICHVIINHEELEARKLGKRMNITDAVNVTHQIISDELLRLRLQEAKGAGKRVLLLRSLTPRPTIWNAHTLANRCVELGDATAIEHREALEGLIAESEPL